MHVAGQDDCLVLKEIDMKTTTEGSRTMIGGGLGVEELPWLPNNDGIEDFDGFIDGFGGFIDPTDI